MKTQNETNCNPSICNRSDLLTEGWFMSKDDITKKCKCEKDSRCKMLVDLLLNGKRKEAEALLDNK